MSMRTLWQAPDIIRLEFWNLLGKYDGHYLVWYRRPPYDCFVYAKHGNYANLVSYEPVPAEQQTLQIPDAEDEAFFRPLIERELASADFEQSTGLAYADCAFAGYGARDRRLLAVRIGGQIRCFCGCFNGTAEELTAYIARHEEHLRPSRNYALKFVLGALDASYNDVTP